MRTITPYFLIEYRNTAEQYAAFVFGADELEMSGKFFSCFSSNKNHWLLLLLLKSISTYKQKSTN